MKTPPTTLALLLGLVILFVGFPVTGRAESYEDQTETILADVIVYRPAGVLLTAAGSALFVVILPFSAIVGGTKHTARTLVKTPFDFTFRRPMGTDLRDYAEDIAVRYQAR